MGTTMYVPDDAALCIDVYLLIFSLSVFERNNLKAARLSLKRTN